MPVYLVVCVCSLFQASGLLERRNKENGNENMTRGSWKGIDLKRLISAYNFRHRNFAFRKRSLPFLRHLENF